MTKYSVPLQLEKDLGVYRHTRVLQRIDCCVLASYVCLLLGKIPPPSLHTISILLYKTIPALLRRFVFAPAGPLFQTERLIAGYFCCIGLPPMPPTRET